MIKCEWCNKELDTDSADLLHEGVYICNDHQRCKAAYLNMIIEMHRIRLGWLEKQPLPNKFLPFSYRGLDFFVTLTIFACLIIMVIKWMNS